MAILGAAGAASSFAASSCFGKLTLSTSLSSSMQGPLKLRISRRLGLDVGSKPVPRAAKTAIRDKTELNFKLAGRPTLQDVWRNDRIDLQAQELAHCIRILQLTALFEYMAMEGCPVANRRAITLVLKGKLQKEELDELPQRPGIYMFKIIDPAYPEAPATYVYCGRTGDLRRRTGDHCRDIDIKSTTWKYNQLAKAIGAGLTIVVEYYETEDHFRLERAILQWCEDMQFDEIFCWNLQHRKQQRREAKIPTKDLHGKACLKTPDELYAEHLEQHGKEGERLAQPCARIPDELYAEHSRQHGDKAERLAQDGHKMIGALLFLSLLAFQTASWSQEDIGSSSALAEPSEVL